MEYTFQVLLANEEQFKKNCLMTMQDVKFDKQDISNYNCVYYGQIKSPSFKSVPELLFFVFNMKHPDDYKHRSLSIGDIVVVNGTMFICENLGFTEIKYDLLEIKL